jgi:putative membrane protein
MKPIISEKTRRQVSAAIKAAERDTSGEIVVVLAHRSDDYLHVPLHYAAAGALALPLIPYLGGRELGWLPIPIGWIFVYQLAVFVFIATVLSVPPLRFYITPRRLMNKYAHRHASSQFLARNLHTTERRTGVLIFVSLLERYCEIVADTTVAKKVDHATWKTIVDAMLEEIRRGNLDGGLKLGITKCGALLAQYFPPRTLNPNELPDHLIVI